MRVVYSLSLFLLILSTCVKAQGFSAEQKYPLKWQAEQKQLRFEVGGQDWQGYETFSLPISSTKQTGARIAIDILGRDDRVLGHTLFVVDWVGDNDMQLWLVNFKPKSDKERFADVQAVRLKCQEPGLWPTTLMVGQFQLLQDEPIWPVNESDVIIDMGWHETMARPELWKIVEDSSTIKVDELIVIKPWPYTKFSYQQKKQPGQLTMERTFDLDLREYSQLLGKMMWDEDTLLTVTAVVDGGRKITLFDGTWKDGWYTFGNSLSGAHHLNSVRLDIKEVQGCEYNGRRIGMGLFYLLLRKPSALDNAPIKEVDVRLVPTGQVWLESHNVYSKDIKTVRRRIPQIPFDKRVVSQTPIGDPIKDGSPFGFMIRKNDISELRKQALEPKGTIKKMFSVIRAEADRALATELVDRTVGGRAYGGGVGLPKGLMGAGMRLFAPQVAMVHLITGEEKYAIAARRWILRTALSEDWRGDSGGCVNRPQIGDMLPYWDSFTGWYPRGFAGYMNHPFMVADVAFGTVVAYDMLYHCFSPEERDLVERAFAEKGVYILYDKLRHNRDYYGKMNQGSWFATPLLMQTAFLRDKDKVYGEMYDWTLKFLKDFGENGPWSKEGVLREGPGYGTHTIVQYIDALMAMSACLDVPISDLLSPSFLSVMDYIQHIRSTSHEEPLTLAWSDKSGKRWVPGVIFAFFARYAKDPVAQYFWDESYSSGLPEDMKTLLLLADNAFVEPKEPNLPPAKVFRDEPLAFLRTGWKYGDTLLAMTNIRHVVGHGHKDRASIILEYNGEDLLLDPGMISYYDPAAGQYQETFCHNTLTFSQRSQLGNEVVLSGGDKIYDTSIRAFLSTSGTVCPGRKGGIDWLIADATAVYPQAKKFQRHIIFLRPDVFVIYDDVQAKKEEMMELNFTCKGPLTSNENTFISSTKRNNLLIHSLATQPLKYGFEEWGTQWKDIPSYRLIRSTIEPTEDCAFLTILVPYPASQKQPNIKNIRIENGIAVQICWPESEYLVICRQDNSNFSKLGIETDAKIVVVSREDGDMIGAAMLMGTNLTIQDSGDIFKGNGTSLLGAVNVKGQWAVEQVDVETYHSDYQGHSK